MLANAPVVSKKKKKGLFSLFPKCSILTDSSEQET
jgi:hypothetical protein